MGHRAGNAGGDQDGEMEMQEGVSVRSAFAAKITSLVTSPSPKASPAVSGEAACTVSCVPNASEQILYLTLDDSLDLGTYKRSISMCALLGPRKSCRGKQPEAMFLEVANDSGDVLCLAAIIDVHISVVKYNVIATFLGALAKQGCIKIFHLPLPLPLQEGTSSVLQNSQTSTMRSRGMFSVLVATILASGWQNEALLAPSARESRATTLDNTLRRPVSSNAAGLDKVDHLPGLSDKLDSDLYSG